jgi:hypothetical protein
LSVRFCVAVPTIVREPGINVTLTITCIVWVAEVNPSADAVIVADPGLTPVTFGSGKGLWDPVPM